MAKHDWEAGSIHLEADELNGLKEHHGTLRRINTEIRNRLLRLEANLYSTTSRRVTRRQAGDLRELAIALHTLVTLCDRIVAQAGQHGPDEVRVIVHLNYCRIHNTGHRKAQPSQSGNLRLLADDSWTGEIESLLDATAKMIRNTSRFLKDQSLLGALIRVTLVLERERTYALRISGSATADTKITLSYQNDVCKECGDAALGSSHVSGE